MALSESEIQEQLEQAQAAYEADDSKTVAALCQAVVEADPDNAKAWDLLAKFGGWDSKMYDFDVDFIIDAATRAVELLPENERYEAAAEIYAARKRQIAKIFESQMMMPSYTSAKQMHGTMMDWKRLLQELPCLSVGLIESEVVLCSNLCFRSKFGFMPSDRLVYTAYMSLNGKESYGDTFRAALAQRIEKEQKEQADRIAALVERSEEQLALLEGENPATRAAKLAQLRGELEDALESILSQSTEVIYRQRIEELERQLHNLGPLKIFKRKELVTQIDATKQKIEQVSAETGQVVAPLRSQIAAIEELERA